MIRALGKADGVDGSCPRRLDSPYCRSINELLTIGATTMTITTIGLDLAKNIFQVHGVTDEGTIAFNKPLRRARVLPFFAKLEPCLIGIEACSSAHYWGRELTALGHDVKLMPPSDNGVHGRVTYV